MPDFRTKNQLLTSKIETTVGTDAVPTPAANAIRVRDSAVYTAGLQKLNSNYTQESISTSPPIIGGGGGSLRVPTWLTGAPNPGQAPDFGVLLRGCAMQQSLTGSDVSATAQAGTTSTITLNAGASAVDDIFNGLIIEITGGTGSGQETRVIYDYVGSTKIATVFPNWAVTPDITSVFAIRAAARYMPITNSLEALTHYLYQHHSNPASSSKRKILLGSMGAWDVAVSPGQLAALNFQFAGIMPGAPTDVAKPSAGVFAGKEPKEFVSAKCYMGAVGAAANVAKITGFSLTSGNGVQQYDDPSQAFGKDTGDIVTRNVSGRLSLPLSLTASRDIFTDWKDEVSRALWIYWGPAVGQRISILIPAARYTGGDDDDLSGYQVTGVPFDATGNDSEVYLTVM